MMKKLDPIPSRNISSAQTKVKPTLKAPIPSTLSTSALKSSINKSSSLSTLKNIKSSVPSKSLSNSSSTTSLVLSKSLSNKKLPIENKSTNTIQVEPNDGKNIESNNQNTLAESQSDPSINTPTSSSTTPSVIPSDTPPISTIIPSNSNILSSTPSISLNTSKSTTSLLNSNNTSEVDGDPNTFSSLSSSQSTPSLNLASKEESTIVVRKGAPNWPAMVSKSNKSNLTVGAAALWMKNHIKQKEEEAPEEITIENKENIINPIIKKKIIDDDDYDDIPTIKFAKKKSTLVRQCEKCQILYANFHNC